MNILGQIFDVLQSLVINIPVNNLLGSFYVVLNLFSQLFALFSFGGSDGTGGGLFGGGGGLS